MIKILMIAIILFLSSCENRISKGEVLREKIEQIISEKQAEVGIAVSSIEDKDTLYINNNKHYPLQSIFKFHIALTVLHQVDEGILSLNQKVFISKSDLIENTWSPLREKYPDGNVTVTLATLLKYTVALSDNIGCDILLRLIGGPETVNHYIHKIGIDNFEIAVNEEAMHKEWDIQFSNWTLPSSTTNLLKMFYDGNILSPKSFDFLWEIMTSTETGKNRIKGQLPKGTIVAHKTGTSGTNKNGITAATNDIGIATLPNGNHYAISIFVSNSKESNEVNEKIISDISKAVWDYYTIQK